MIRTAELGECSLRFPVPLFHPYLMGILDHRGRVRGNGANLSDRHHVLQVARAVNGKLSLPSRPFTLHLMGDKSCVDRVA